MAGTARVSASRGCRPNYPKHGRGVLPGSGATAAGGRCQAPPGGPGGVALAPGRAPPGSASAFRKRIPIGCRVHPDPGGPLLRSQLGYPCKHPMSHIPRFRVDVRFGGTLFHPDDTEALPSRAGTGLARRCGENTWSVLAWGPEPRRSRRHGGDRPAPGPPGRGACGGAGACRGAPGLAPCAALGRHIG